MIIKKYKLFENKIELDEERSKLLEMAIDTGDLDLVKFFVNKGFKSENVLSVSIDDEKIFRYFLSKGVDIEEIKNNPYLKKTNIQKSLIDYGYEQFVYDQVGFNSELKNDPKYKNLVDMTEETEKYNM